MRSSGSDAAIMIDDSESMREMVVIAREDDELVVLRMGGRSSAL